MIHILQKCCLLHKSQVCTNFPLFKLLKNKSIVEAEKKIQNLASRAPTIKSVNQCFLFWTDVPHLFQALNRFLYPLGLFILYLACLQASIKWQLLNEKGHLIVPTSWDTLLYTSLCSSKQAPYSSRKLVFGPGDHE